MSILNHLNLSIALASSSTAQAQFGIPMIVDEHTVTANRQDGPYTSEAEMETAGFTTAAVPDIREFAANFFAQSPHGSAIMIGRRAAAEALDDALTAIEADNPASWFYTASTTRADLDLTDAAAWHETRKKIFVGQSSSAAMLAGTGGNIGETLSAANYNNTALLYYNDDAQAFDGALLGRVCAFALDAPRGSGSWAYHRLASLPGSTLTTAQRTQLLAYNCNWHAGVTYTSGVNEAASTFPGRAVSGRSLKVQTSLHMLGARWEEAFYKVFLEVASSTEPALLFDDRGIGKLKTAGVGVLRKMVTGGHFLGDVVSSDTGLLTPRLAFPRASKVSSTDRQAGRLSGITGEVIVAPEIISIGDLTNVGLTATLKFT